MMSPRRLSSRLTDHFSGEMGARRIMWWVGGLLAASATCGGLARGAKAMADETYVRRDTFAIVRVRDSSNAQNATHEIRAVLFGLDSSDRCRRGQQGFCR